MDTREFWTLIEQTKAESNGDRDRHEALLIEQLAAMPIEDIVDYQRIQDELMRHADQLYLYDAAVIIQDGCGSDGFADFRAGLIAQGRTIYESALHDPETLAEIIDAGEYLSDELKLYIASFAYRRKTGDDGDLFYQLAESVGPINLDVSSEASNYIQLEWTTDEEYERAIQERYPKLFEKFYLYWKLNPFGG